MQSLMNQPLILCGILFFGSTAGQAPGPAAGVHEEIPSVRISFDIENLDYEAVAENDEANKGIRDAVHGCINRLAEEAVAGGPAGPPMPAAPPAALAPGGFIELSNSSGHKIFQTRKAPRSALSHSTRHSLAQPPPAPGPAPGPALPDVVDTFVALEEGPELALLQQSSKGRACVEVNAYMVDAVDVALASAPSPAAAGSPYGPMFIDRGSHSLSGKPGMATPGFGMTLKKEMKDVCKNKQILANALLGAEGVQWKHAPSISNCKVTIEKVQSFHLDCAPHIETLLKRFTLAYTRAQVPHALEEACHLFESKVSFSGNRRITKWDKRICKKATEKLMNEWQPEIKVHGANFRKSGVGKWGVNATGGKPGARNYQGWCDDLCEWKYGRGAPQCRLGTDKIPSPAAAPAGPA